MSAAVIFGAAALAAVAIYAKRAKAATVQSSDTYTVQDIAAIVDQVNAAEFGGWFNPADVLAVIQIESSFDPYAYRLEPTLGDASVGLMQVLVRTARDRGLVGDWQQLFDPMTNITIGMRHLKWSFDYLDANMGTPTDDEWISSYNTGVGNAVRGYMNRGYVAKWRAARGRYA